MTQRRDVGTVLERWFVDGVDHMPDSVFLTILDRVEREPQRPAWRLLPWRFPTMPTPIKLAAIGVALLAVLLGGAVFLGGGSATPVPASTPTPSPSATAAAPSPSPSPIACEDDLPGCSGPFASGSHTSTAFQPPLTFTTPEGWKNVVDTPTIYKLDPVSGTAPYLIAWSNPAIPEGCGPAIKPGTGTEVTDFVDFIETHPGIEVLSNTEGLVGGSPARILDLRVKASYTGACPGLAGSTVQFIVDTDPLAGTPIYGVASGSRMHVLIVDVNGRTVIIQAYGPDSDSGFAAAIDVVQPLIDSFRFNPAN